MDFVARHQYAVFGAEVGKTCQLVAAPYKSAGVVRIAENHHARTLLGKLALEQLEVHLYVSVVAEAQRISDHLAAVALDDDAERMVDGLLYQHLVALVGKHLKCHRKSADNAGNECQLVAFHAESMAVEQPILYRLPITEGCYRIAEHLVLQPVAQSFCDGGTHLEIHISHPKRQKVASTIVLLQTVVFYAAGVPAVDCLVEIHCETFFANLHKKHKFLQI